MALRNRRVASKKQGGLSPESPAAQGLCLCEIAGCNTPRNKYTHGAGRWCRFHGVTGDLSRDDAGSYTNRNGRHDYGPRWGAPVKFSARFGFVLEHLEPLDNVVARAMVRAWLASAVPGRWVEATVLVEMFLGHSIKWVKEVGRWQELVDASHLRLAGVSTAETLVEAYRNVILWSDGRAWPKMFHRMNHGRAHATTGLAVSAGQLGLLGKRDSGETGQIVRLGPAQTAYLLKADTSIAIKLVQALLVLAKDAVRWPARHIEEDLQLFAGQLLKFASDARSLRMGKAGFTGGTSPVAYHVRLDPESTMAYLTLSIDSGIELPADTSAMIVSESVLSGKHVKLDPGGSFDMMGVGDSVEYVQDSVIIEGILERIVRAAEQRRDERKAGEEQE